MADVNIKKRLAEGIVKLVEELIDYKTDISIGGFVKITADKCNVFPITLREYRKKEISSMKKRKSLNVTTEKFNKGGLSGKKRKLFEELKEDAIDKTPSKKIKGACKEPTENTVNLPIDLADTSIDITCEKRQRQGKKLIRRNVIKSRDVETEEGFFPCMMCKYQNKYTAFNSEHKLLTHGRMQHRRQDGYKCQSCNQTFKSFFKLHNHHYYMHSKIKNYVCKSCKKSFTWALEIRRHSKEHKSFRYTCMKCPWPGKSFYNYSLYAYHVKTGHRETKCKKCRGTFESRIELREHFRKAHITQKIKRKKRKMVEKVKGKMVKEVKAREVPKPQSGLSEAEKNVVFVKTVKSKTGKETKVK